MYGSQSAANNMLALNLLYKGYIADARVFSCPQKRILPALLTAIPDTTSGRTAPSMTSAQSSYGYDSKHTQADADATAAIAADAKGAGANSDHHGPNAGQNILFAPGHVEFRDSPIIDHGGAGGIASIIDTDIYAPGTLTPGAPTGLESEILGGSP